MSYVRVYQASRVTTALLKKNPPDLFIGATGQVNSSGWTEPQLSAWMYIKPPADGILDFDFIAKKPSGVVLWALCPISADTTLPDIDLLNYWGKGIPLKGVRIHAASNSKESKFAKPIKSGKIAFV